MTRIEILQKLAAGEITVEEATRLLQETNAEPAVEAAPENAAEAQPEASAQAGAESAGEPKSRGAVKARWLRIRVSNGATNREYVKINIPFGFFHAGRWMGRHFWHHRWDEKWDQIMDAIDRGEVGTLLEVEDDSGGDRVHIYVE